MAGAALPRIGMSSRGCVLKSWLTRDGSTVLAVEVPSGAGGTNGGINISFSK